MDLLIEAIGWAGAAALLLAYGLLSGGRISSGTVYQLLNLGGSVALAVNAFYHRALPSAVLNVIWLIIGLAALRGLAARHIRDRAAEAADARQR